MFVSLIFSLSDQTRKSMPRFGISNTCQIETSDTIYRYTNSANLADTMLLIYIYIHIIEPPAIIYAIYIYIYIVPMHIGHGVRCAIHALVSTIRWLSCHISCWVMVVLSLLSVMMVHHISTVLYIQHTCDNKAVTTVTHKLDENYTIFFLFNVCLIHNNNVCFSHSSSKNALNDCNLNVKWFIFETH